MDRLEELGVRCARGLAEGLPERFAWAAGRAMGRAAFGLGLRRRVCRENLERAFGATLDAGARAALAQRTYDHLGTTFMEFLRLPRTTQAQRRDRVVFEGREHLEAAQAGGRGAIAASGHLGNWEMIGASIAAHGFPMTFVVQRLRNRRVDALVNAIRSGAGIQVIERGMALRNVHAALRENRLVFLMCDQDARRRGVFVPFFGVPASTHIGAAQLALRLGVPFVPAFTWRRDDGRHTALFTPPIAPPQAPEQEAVLVLLNEFNRRLEAAIRRAPEQYWWSHRRWKTRPPGG